MSEEVKTGCPGRMVPSVRTLASQNQQPLWVIARKAIESWDEREYAARTVPTQ